MKAVNKTSAHWWERAIVCVLFVAAIFYARSARGELVESAKSAVNESAVCPPKAMQALARVCMAHGDYDKAETLIDRALEAVAAGQGSEEEQSACLIDLGWVYKNQGRFTEAEESCRLGLRLQEQLYYADHPYIAYTLRILGSIYQAQGDYGRAGASFERAISIIRKCHSADDVVTASFEVDAARLLTAEGKFAQAEAAYERALRVISDYYGAEHLYTAAVLGDVAKLYYLQGRLDEAQAILDCTLDIQQKVYGQEHRLLVPNQLTMVRIFRARGDVEQAERLLTKSLAVLETRPAGTSQPLQGEILTILADIYVDSGNFAEAQSACDRAIAMLEKSLGNNNEIIAMAFNCRARIYILQGRFTQAYEFGCEALTTLETALDTTHPSITAVNKTIRLAQELETVALLAKAE